MQRNRRYDDEVIEDGGRVTVPLTMMDAIDAAYPPRLVKDAKLHRPGFRPQDGYASTRALREKAYADYEQQICDAWQGDATKGFKNVLSGGGVTSGFENVLGGSGTDKNTGFGESGQRGSVAGDPCTLNGWPGKLVQGEGGKLVCRIESRHNDDADPDFPRKKQKRNARNQEEGTEEYEKDSHPDSIKRAFGDLAHKFNLLDSRGAVSWDKVSYLAAQLGDNDDDDDDDNDDDEAAIERVAKLYANITEGTQRRDVPDHKSIDALRADRQRKTDAAFKAYDDQLSQSWRGEK